MDVMKFVRVYLNDECGLFLPLDSDGNLERMRRAIEMALDR